jgi:hypothetical protein
MTPELMRACEVVFQEHKTTHQPVNWHKNAFHGRISIGLSEVAKETLLKNKIIRYTNQGKKNATVLHPEMAAAITFEEALIIAHENTPVMVTTTSETRRVRVIDDFEENSFIDEPEAPSLTLVKVTGEINIAANPAKWYARPLFYYIIGPTCALLLGVVIAFLLSEYITKLL